MKFVCQVMVAVFYALTFCMSLKAIIEDPSIKPKLFNVVMCCLVLLAGIAFALWGAGAFSMLLGGQ